MSDYESQFQMNKDEKEAFDLLLKECDYHYLTEDFLKSEDDLNYFLTDLVIHTNIFEVRHHIAVYALEYWIEKHHPDKHKIYSAWLHELLKKDYSDFLTLISI